MTIFGINLPLK